MIALDTNVLARYFVRDDARQAAAADRLIRSKCTRQAPGVIALIVVCELVWVLAAGYGYSKAEICALLRGILGAEDLSVERSQLVWQALNQYEDGKADFADYLIALCGRAEGAEATYTFDRRTKDCALFKFLSS